MKPVALITGASRGIGRAIAVELSSTHEILATYRGRRDAAESLRAEIGAEIFACDIGSGADRSALVAFAKERFGHVDLLVNNAGMAPRERRDLLDATEESFDELIGVNLKGPHFLTQQVARDMVERGSGRIVFITSISAYTASVNRGEYCISKAGLSMSVALWAARLAAHNIQVFEIRPGIIRTDMISAVEDVYEKRIADGLLPQRRMGEGSDIGRAVRAIAEGSLDYSTGQIINVDGGFHLRTLSCLSPPSLSGFGAWLESFMKTSFRKAVLPGEIGALLAFDRRVFPKADRFDRDYWNEVESHWLLVGGVKAGCCAFEKQSKGSLYIATTGILPRFQGQGLGALLKAWQIAYARYHGYNRIITNCRKRNSRMIALNRQFGFRIVRTIPRYYAEPADSAVLMELLLKNAT